jgi:transcription antitermination factor NusG
VENDKDGRVHAWHIMWSPSGFGNNTARIVELYDVIKRDDAKSEMYFPTYKDRMRDREVMIPLFPNYVFVKCRWHGGLEDRVRDNSGAYIAFLRGVGREHPYTMTEEELLRVKKALQDRLDLVEEIWHVEDFVVGDRVLVKSNKLTGQIMYFLPPNKAMILTTMFNRPTPMPVKLDNLERL